MDMFAFERISREYINTQENKARLLVPNVQWTVLLNNVFENIDCMEAGRLMFNAVKFVSIHSDITESDPHSSLSLKTNSE